MKLKDLKEQSVTFVMLNGFKEHIDYVLSLTDIKYIGEIKSEDGYGTIHCYVC